MIAGTIRNSVNLTFMDSKWQQKKQNINCGNVKELTAEERELQFYQQQADEIRENRKPSEIRTKLNSGAELTAEEIEYLRKNNPELLRTYEEIKKERENYKKQLKNCKSKEEVERLRTTKMSEFMAECKSISSNANIPKDKKLGLLQKLLRKANGVQAEHLEFIRSAQYQMLPDEDEDKKKKKDRLDGEKPETEESGPKELTVAGDELFNELLRALSKEGCAVLKSGQASASETDADMENGEAGSEPEAVDIAAAGASVTGTGFADAGTTEDSAGTGAAAMAAGSAEAAGGTLDIKI